MLCVDNYAGNVAAGTLYTLLVGQTAWLQQHRPPDWIQSLESRPQRGGGRVLLDSGASSSEEGLPSSPNSVGRALVLSGVRDGRPKVI